MTRGDNKLKAQVRALQELYHLPYAEALRRVQTPRHWQLTPDVEALFAGHGIRGIDLSAPQADLRFWLDYVRTPTGMCEICHEPVDARDEPAAICFEISSYDPDANPRTNMLATHLRHPACGPSEVRWMIAAILPGDPSEFALRDPDGPDQDDPASADGELYAHPVLTRELDGAVGEWFTGPEPVLCLEARIVNPADGAVGWLSLLGDSWREEDLGDLESTVGTCSWSVRVVTGYPLATGKTNLLFVREDTDEDGEATGHVYRAARDLPTAWLDAARAATRVLVVCGPLPVHDEEPEPWNPADGQASIETMLREGRAVAAYVPVVVEEYREWPPDQAA